MCGGKRKRGARLGRGLGEGKRGGQKGCASGPVVGEYYRILYQRPLLVGTTEIPKFRISSNSTR